jgi:4-diphosphocytidyl-2-C-methyl-D-erythritol kinase
VSILRTLAPGKVNLCLYVGQPRADGLHPLVSVVQPLSLADELSLEPAPPGSEGDEVICDGVAGPNLAASALAVYREASGWDAPPQRLTIVKWVPVAAGMGGGSGDAAAALRLAAHAAGRPEDPLLAGLAAALGSDVPAQLAFRRCLMTGAGERVEPLPLPAPGLGVLVVPVDAELSTADVYGAADRMGLPRAAGELAELESTVRAAALAGSLPPELMVNDLAPAARELCPAIEPVLAAVAAAGAERAMVTGSGPTVIGLFEGAKGDARAQAAARDLRERHPRAAAATPAGPEAARVW